MLKSEFPFLLNKSIELFKTEFLLVDLLCHVKNWYLKPNLYFKRVNFMLRELYLNLKNKI